METGRQSAGNEVQVTENIAEVTDIVVQNTAIDGRFTESFCRLRRSVCDPRESYRGFGNHIAILGIVPRIAAIDPRSPGIFPRIVEIHRLPG